MKISKIFLFAFFAIFFQKTICILKENPMKAQRKLEGTEPEEEQESLVDVRGILGEKEGDNPLSDLFDANHMKIAKQNVNLNMNMPLNRLKLHLDKSYQVKIVVENDEDFDRLYDYFYPKPKEEEKESVEEEGESQDRRLWKIKKSVKK